MIAELGADLERSLHMKNSGDKLLPADLLDFMESIRNKDVSFYGLSDSEKQKVYRLASLRLVKPLEQDGQLLVKETGYNRLVRYFKNAYQFS